MSNQKNHHRRPPIELLTKNEETFEYKIIIPVKKSKIIISISDSIPKNSLGKRLILQKLYEKKVHNAKMFFSTFPKIEWLSSLEKNVWHSFDSIIRQAKEESDKLGELCELITYFDKHYSVYLEKEDLESEIKLIKSELNAQKCDFLL